MGGNVLRYFKSIAYKDVLLRLVLCLEEFDFHDIREDGPFHEIWFMELGIPGVKINTGRLAHGQWISSRACPAISPYVLNYFLNHFVWKQRKATK